MYLSSLPCQDGKTETRKGGSFPKYDAAEIKRGITFKTTPSKPNRAGFVNTIRIQNKSMIGAIYETAGRKNGQGQDWVGPSAGGASKGVSRSVNPYAGNQFISNLGNLYGSKRGGNDHRMMGRLILEPGLRHRARLTLEYLRQLKTPQPDSTDELRWSTLGEQHE